MLDNGVSLSLFPTPKHWTELTCSFVQTSAYIINPDWKLQLSTLLLLLSSVDVLLTKCLLCIFQASYEYLKHIAFSLLCPYYF